MFITRLLIIGFILISCIIAKGSEIVVLCSTKGPKQVCKEVYSKKTGLDLTIDQKEQYEAYKAFKTELKKETKSERYNFNTSVNYTNWQG